MIDATPMDKTGIRCPVCSRTGHEVTETRRGPNKIRRRRRCTCGHAFATVEVIHAPPHTSRVHLPTIKRMREAGETYEKIAAHLGVSLTTVWKRYNGL